MIKALTCVDVGVLLHVGLLVEPLATEVAGVRPGVAVDQEVGRESAAPLERLSTLRALEQGEGQNSQLTGERSL